MNQLTSMLLEVTANTTSLLATTLTTADGVFYNPSATRGVLHLSPKHVQTSGLLRGKPIRTYSSCTKNWVTHADSECFELEATAAKRRPGWRRCCL